MTKWSSHEFISPSFEFEMGDEGEQMRNSSSGDSLPRERHDILRSASIASSGFPGRERSNTAKRSFLQRGLPKAAKIAFLVLNSLTLLFFLGLMAIDLFLMVSAYYHLFHLSFKLVLLFAGLAGTLLAVLGIVGVVKENRIVLMIYSLFLLVLFLLQLGFFIFIMSGRENLSVILQGTWASSTEEIKNAIQEEFQCCGYRDPNDFAGPNCRPEWTQGCLPAIKSSLVDHLPSVLGVSISIIFVELMSLALSTYLILRLPTKTQLIALELEEAWRKTLGGDHEPLEVF